MFDRQLKTSICFDMHPVRFKMLSMWYRSCNVCHAMQVMRCRSHGYHNAMLLLFLILSGCYMNAFFTSDCGVGAVLCLCLVNIGFINSTGI